MHPCVQQSSGHRFRTNPSIFRSRLSSQRPSSSLSPRLWASASRSLSLSPSLPPLTSVLVTLPRAPVARRAPTTKTTTPPTSRATPAVLPAAPARQRRRPRSSTPRWLTTLSAALPAPTALLLRLPLRAVLPLRPLPRPPATPRWTMRLCKI